VTGQEDTTSDRKESPEIQPVDVSFLDQMYEKYPMKRERERPLTTTADPTEKKQVTQQVDVYSHVLNDIETYEAKNKFKGKPDLPTELNSLFSGMSENEKVKVLLQLTDQTLHEKLDNVPNIQSRQKGSATKIVKRAAPPVFAQDVPPVDSSLLYATTNSSYSGLHSDNAKLLQHATSRPSEEKKTLDWKSLGHVDVDGSNEALNNQVKTVKNAMDSFERNIKLSEKKKKK
jgi:hypothetical protein